MASAAAQLLQAEAGMHAQIAAAPHLCCPSMFSLLTSACGRDV